MITIVDYGLGNIKAFANVYKCLNIPVSIARSKNDLANASRVILPGVGAFDHAMTLLNKSGMRDELENLVLHKKTPILGICVGMQMMAMHSEEGALEGLGWINGEVRRLDASKIPFKTRLPHMGWNTIRPESESPLLDGFTMESRFYFLHSYYFFCTDASETIATTEYGMKFVCGVNSANIFGVQFHPEKSHSNGIRLLQNFSRV